MAYIASINGSTRRVYLDPAAVVAGVLTVHPCVDLYPEYKAMRAANEATRPYYAFLEARGNEAKNIDGSKRTPRYVKLLAGTKLVIPANVTQLNVTGELLTDDGSDPFDRSLAAGVFIDYTPPAAEIIRVATSGNAYSLLDISAAVVASLQATTIPVDAVTGAWPTAVENADALLSRTWP